jgi:glycosyltransferase involved in cell wall biosynthesis
MPDVCLVVPCYNEAARLRIADFLAHIDADPRSCLCFVNDGSTDDTASTLEGLAKSRPGRIFSFSLAQNSGKGEAVRQGINHVAAMQRFAFVGYWDADLATPLSELAPMLDLLARAPDCQLVLGSRWRRLGSDIQRSAIRHALGRVFATAASLTLDLPVYDSQCGAKLCRAESIGVLFGEPFITRWLFDVELLARLRNRGWVTGVAVELPLSAWRDIGGSRLGWTQMAAAPLGLLSIRRRYPPR